MKYDPPRIPLQRYVTFPLANCTSRDLVNPLIPHYGKPAQGNVFERPSTDALYLARCHLVDCASSSPFARRSSSEAELKIEIDVRIVDSSGYMA